MRTIRRTISRQSRFCPSRLCPSRLRPSRFCMVAATAGHLAACLGIGSSASADSPFASAVISYVAGTGAATGFTNAASTLGSPERFSGEGLIPGAVTPFQPAFRPDEIVSLGVGGSLVVTFDHDVTDDPRNPFGIDLIVFGNAFFTDSSFGVGVVAGLATEGGTIAVSADAVAWTTVRGLAADGLFPTLGYQDVGPYSTTAGQVPTDFLRPMNPTISFSSLVGLGYEALLDKYDGSGGGVGIDIGALGLSAIRFVRISGPTVSGFSPEVDAFSDVAALPPQADLDGNGAVGAGDLAMLLSAWGTSDPAADLDGSGMVGSTDLAFILSAWTMGATP